MQKQVIITIKADGATVVEADNFMGVGCTDATRQFEMALAGLESDNVKRDPKPEMYQQDMSYQNNFGQ